MSDRIQIEIKDGVADVRLTRPEKMNALDRAMFVALCETGKNLAREPGLRAVVLSGEGRGFCAGLDFMSFQKTKASADESDAETDAPHGLLDLYGTKVTTFAQYAAWVWQQLPVPVIAAIHGVAFGGGLQIALAADIRFATPDAKLSVMEIKWGLVPDMTGTQTLRNLVRLDVAKELTYTGRIVLGTEAHALGLVTRLAEDPREAAFGLAREIAGRSPSAVRASKRLLDASRAGSVDDGLLREAEIQRTVIGGPNQVEAVMANIEKRPPQFHDPS
ncbi:MAG: crotonase/enoyl-CoA hydratase family protein [Myxococcota bacterium]|jgi:enoyl-CoA hydratase/carnithine racemase